jgi:hypothetical protein
MSKAEQASYLPQRHHRIVREGLSALVEHVFPTTFQEQNNSVEMFNYYMDDGYGMIIVMPHFSKREGVNALLSLGKRSPQLIRSEIVIPIARHQYKQPGIFVGGLAQAHYVPIITPDTEEYAVALKDAGKKVPWEEENQRRMYVEYLKAAEHALQANGVVAIAPQGGRKARLHEFEGDPISHLLGRTKHNPKVALALLGAEVVGFETYDPVVVGGYNRKEHYIITLGDVLTKATLIDSAKTMGRTIDQEIAVRMNDLAPQAYKAAPTDIFVAPRR